MKSPAPENQTKKSSAARNVLAIMAVAILGLLFGYGVGTIGMNSSASEQHSSNTEQLNKPQTVGSKLLNGVTAFGIMVVVMHVVLGVHEWGHVLGGQSAGFRFMMFVVGPIRILRQGHRIRVGWNTNLSLVGGIASVLPPTASTISSRVSIEEGMMRFIVGGPIASLVLALLAGLPFAVQWVLPEWTGLGGLLSLFFGATSVMSFIIFCGTATPHHSSGFSSDGARALMLQKNDAAAKRWCALGILGGAMMSDIRPRDLEERYFHDALALADKTPDDLSAHLFTYQWALDKENIEEAERHLDYAAKHLDVYPEAFRPIIAMEVAYFEARHRKNPESARQWFSTGHKTSFVEPPSRLRVEAALALAEGRDEEAGVKARQGLRLLAAKPHLTGSETMEQDLLNDILQQITNEYDSHAS
jgi:hypothetical protein